MQRKFIFIAKENTNYKFMIETCIDNILYISILQDPNFNKIEIKHTTYYEFIYQNKNIKRIIIDCEYLNPKFKIHIKENKTREVITTQVDEEEFEAKQISFNNNDIIQKNITQIYMNEHLKITFLEDIKKMYNLREYDNDNEPSFFYGLINDKDISVLEKNKSMKVIVWIGGDINYEINRTPNVAKTIKNNVERILAVPNIKHVSISSFIRTSLDNLNLPYKMIPFMGANFSKYKPVKKGPCIYLYTAFGVEKYYGYDLYTKIIEKYSKRINFYVTCCLLSYKEYIKKPSNAKHKLTYYDKEQLINEVYPNCFLGLRLTDHDGLSATVQELGLMGIKTIHNGCSPSALNYKNFDDICQHIEKEILTIGTIDAKLALDVKKYLTIDPQFFTTEFHK